MKVLVPLFMAALMFAAVLFVLFPLAIGYETIATHEPFTVGHKYWLEAWAALVVTILLPVYVAWNRSGKQ